MSLLDVNVLVALFDSDHPHHQVAHDWFEDSRQEGWATCPATENGFLRCATRPEKGFGLRVREALTLLRQFRATSGHAFWTDAVSLCDETLFDPAFVQGHRQLTDVYLLGLAMRTGGCLATFDRTIPLRAVIGATADTLQIIAPAG